MEDCANVCFRTFWPVCMPNAWDELWFSDEIHTPAGQIHCRWWHGILLTSRLNRVHLHETGASVRILWDYELWLWSYKPRGKLYYSDAALSKLRVSFMNNVSIIFVGPFKNFFFFFFNSVQFSFNFSGFCFNGLKGCVISSLKLQKYW